MADLSNAEWRALNDLVRYPSYRGGSADSAVLVKLEAKGLVELIEIAADRQPRAHITKKGYRTHAHVRLQREAVA